MFENILFKETENGRIKCGVCEVECTKLVVHMNENKYCTEYFSDMDKFKVDYSKYRDRLSRRKNANQRQANTLEGRKRKQSFEPKHCGTNPPADGVQDGRSDTSKKNAKEYEKEGYFRIDGIEFKEAGDGKIRCGVCNVECIRLVAHMNGSKKCVEKFCMPDFRTEYSKYRHRLRVRKSEQNCLLFK